MEEIEKFIPNTIVVNGKKMKFVPVIIFHHDIVDIVAKTSVEVVNVVHWSYEEVTNKGKIKTFKGKIKKNQAIVVKPNMAFTLP